MWESLTLTSAISGVLSIGQLHMEVFFSPFPYFVTLSGRFTLPWCHSLSCLTCNSALFRCWSAQVLLINLSNSSKLKWEFILKLSTQFKFTSLLFNLKTSKNSCPSMWILCYWIIFKDAIGLYRAISRQTVSKNPLLIAQYVIAKDSISLQVYMFGSRHFIMTGTNDNLSK